MITHQCRQCGASFLNKAKTAIYCSRECAGTALKNPITYYCLQCGHRFATKRVDRVPKFCSRTCANLFRAAQEDPQTRRSLMKKAAKESPLRGPYPTNASAKAWRLRAPNNVVYEFKNLNHFIRTHEHLFSKEDVTWVKRPSRCRASGGLVTLSPDRIHSRLSWKGWTWVSIVERRENDGDTLLNLKPL